MVLCDAAVAQRVQGVLEFPECVALEIEAYTSVVSIQILKSDCAYLPTSQRLRHGKRSIFHSYHAFLKGPGAFAMVVLRNGLTCASYRYMMGQLVAVDVRHLHAGPWIPVHTLQAYPTARAATTTSHCDS